MSGKYKKQMKGKEKSEMMLINFTKNGLTGKGGETLSV